MDYHHLDDGALLRLMAHRQEQALSEIYDRFSRLVFSVALNVLADEALAEEVTQDVFLRVWDKAETFDPNQGRVSTWLASVARHRAIDILRSRRIRAEGNLAGFSIDDALDLPAPVDVEHEAEQNRRRQRLRRAMAQLPEAQRQALAYAYLLGYSHSQIAAALNQPLGTVKTRIRMAMQSLRNLLADETPFD